MVVSVAHVTQPRDGVRHVDSFLHNRFVTVLVIMVLLQTELVLGLGENGRCRTHSGERNTFVRVQTTSSVVERSAS